MSERDTHRVRLSRLLDVVGRDDDRVAAVRAEPDQVVPDAGQRRRTSE